MKKFEEPMLQVVKFACNSEAITTSTYVVEIDTNGYNNSITEVVDNAGFFLDNL